MENSKETETKELGAEMLLNKEEMQGIITLLIIFGIGFYSILAPALWVNIIGWFVLGFVGLSAWKILKEIKRRTLEIKNNKIEKEVQN